MRTFEDEAAGYTGAEASAGSGSKTQSVSVGIPILPSDAVSDDSKSVTIHATGSESDLKAGKDSVDAVETVLTALCHCVTSTVRRGAASEGIYFKDICVHAHATLDPKVLANQGTPCNGQTLVQTIHMDIAVKGSVSPEKCRRIAEIARRSPVHALIVNSATVFTTVMSG